MRTANNAHNQIEGIAHSKESTQAKLREYQTENIAIDTAKIEGIAQSKYSKEQN